MELKIIEQGEELRSVDLADSNILIVCNDGSGSEPEHINDFEYLRLDDKNVIKQSYVMKAVRICGKYSGLLSHIYPHSIMFLVDEAWELTEKTSANSRWKIEISRTPGMVRKLTGFDYTMRMRRCWLEKWTDAQLHAAILSQLLRINRNDGSILRYTEDHNSRMVATFGANYLEPGTVIGDILEENIKIRDYRQASGQITFDELGDDGQLIDDEELDSEPEVENEPA